MLDLLVILARPKPAPTPTPAAPATPARVVSDFTNGGLPR